MDGEARTETNDALLIQFEERITALEKIAVFLPAMAAEALLALSLFLPFVTVTSSSDDDEIVTLLQLGLAFFWGEDGGETDGVGVLFAIAFLGLFIVLLCNVVGLTFLARGRCTGACAKVISVFAAQLLLGSAGAWLVIGLGSASESPWLPEAASFTLIAAALLVATLTFLAAFRSIWTRR